MCANGYLASLLKRTLITKLENNLPVRTSGIPGLALLLAFAGQEIFSLSFGMLRPEAETWASLAGLLLATTADFFAVGR